MDLARRVTDGVFTAIGIYLLFTLSSGFAEIVTSGASAVGNLAYTLQGRSDPLGRPR